LNGVLNPDQDDQDDQIDLDQTDVATMQGQKMLKGD